MISNTYKVIVLEDGSEYCFSTKAFKQNIQKYINQKREAGEKITKSLLIQNLANATFVSPNAVYNWLYGKNGTGELNTIKFLAKELNIDYMELLEKIDIEKEDKTMNNTIPNNEQIETVTRNYSDWNTYVCKELTLETSVATKRAIRECVQYIVECIANYIDTLGYNLYWTEDSANYYTKKFDKLFIILYRNMVDLPFELYNELEKFISQDMKPIIYYYGNLTPSEHEKYEYAEAMKFVDVYDEEEFFWELKENCKKECQPLFNKLHQIVKPYI